MLTTWRGATLCNHSSLWGRWRGMPSGAARECLQAQQACTTSTSQTPRDCVRRHGAPGQESLPPAFVARHFRTAIVRNNTETHIVDRLVLEAPVAALRRLATIARRMHVGNVNAYAAYVLLTLLAVLVLGARVF